MSRLSHQNQKHPERDEVAGESKLARHRRSDNHLKSGNKPYQWMVYKPDLLV